MRTLNIIIKKRRKITISDKGHRGDTEDQKEFKKFKREIREMVIKINNKNWVNLYTGLENNYKKLLNENID